MPLVLSLPGLLARDAYPPAPSLARLIALARPPERDEAIDALLAPRYGVVRQGDWPLASIRLAALGVDPGDRYWLSANPVTIVAGRDDLLLEREVSDLSADDAQQLVETLNAHFAADSIAFVAPRPDAWFLRADSAPALATHPLDAARGRTLRELMPHGPDARTWRRYQNEIQMLLFEHPVNVAREQAAKLPANSVWLEYGGTRAARTPSHAIRTWTDNATVAALAAFARSPAQPLPASVAECLANAEHDETVVAFAGPVDVDAVERAFARPALHALARGTVDTVTIVADGGGVALSWRAERPSLWSRWTRRFGERDLAANLALAEDR